MGTGYAGGSVSDRVQATYLLWIIEGTSDMPKLQCAHFRYSSASSTASSGILHTCVLLLKIQGVSHGSPAKPRVLIVSTTYLGFWEMRLAVPGKH